MLKKAFFNLGVAAQEASCAERLAAATTQEAVDTAVAEHTASMAEWNTLSEAAKARAENLAAATMREKSRAAVAQNTILSPFLACSQL